jgi:basic membrane protein A
MMHLSQPRRLRVLVPLLLLGALVACGGGSKPAAGGTSGGATGKQLRVAGLFTQSVDQGNWDVAGFHAFDAMCKKYNFQCTHIEQVTYEKAPALMRDLATQGYDLIAAHSSGFAAAIEEVAPQFPKTQFTLFGFADSTKDIANYSAWSMNWNQVGYMIGVVAATASKDGHIAYIGGEKLPSSTAYIDTIQKGAKQANPNIKFDRAFVGSWTDVAKAKEIALQELDSGADFLIPGADTADAGTQQAAEERKALTFGEYVDESPRYPDAVVTSFVLNMDAAYDQMGDLLVKGKLGNQILQMSVQTNSLQFIEPFRHVDPAVQDRVTQIMEQLKSGELQP